MNDLKLNADHELSVESFDLKLIGESDQIAQNVKQTLLMFKGEWYLDTDAGIPWVQEILGKRNYEETVRSIIVNAITNVNGVEEVTSFEQSFDSTTRHLTLTIEIMDIYNTTNKIELLL